MYNNDNVTEENLVIIQKEYTKKYGSNAILTDKGETSIASDVDMALVNPNVIFLIALIGYSIALIYAINIVSFWIEKRKKEMCIRKAFGYTNLNICKMIYSEMILNAFFAAIIGLIIQYILSLCVGETVEYDLGIYPINIIVSFVTIIFTGVLTCIWPMIKIIKIQPAEAIK